MDDSYTISDHEFRDADPYARGKYDTTLRWLSELPAGSTLYNIGCGAGLFNQMASDAGFDVTGFEPDPAAFAIAAKRATAWRVEQAGLFDLAGRHPADVVVVHDVVEHLPDDRAASMALRSVLRTGGTLVVSVPAMPSLFGLHDEQLGHYRRYRRASLQAALGAEFEFQHLRYYGLSFIPVTWWFSKFRRIAYPVDEVGRGGAVGRIVAAMCTLESRLPAPLGTSVIGLARAV